MKTYSIKYSFDDFEEKLKSLNKRQASIHFGKIIYVKRRKNKVIIGGRMCKAKGFINNENKTVSLRVMILTPLLSFLIPYNSILLFIIVAERILIVENYIDPYRKAIFYTVCILIELGFIWTLSQLKREFEKRMKNELNLIEINIDK